MRVARTRESRRAGAMMRARASPSLPPGRAPRTRPAHDLDPHADRMLIPLLVLLGSEHVVLNNATVHTFEPGASPAVATVLIENDRIVAIGADVEVPADAIVHDFTGLHLLPGLVDGMVNFDADHDRLYTSAGVTLVRDVGNDLARIMVEQTREARERAPGPWIWSAGAPLDGPKPSTLAATVLDDPEQAEKKLEALFALEQSPDYLSFMPGLPKEMWRLAITKGHAARRQVWGTLPRGVALAEALEAGQDGFFHLDSFLPAGKTWSTVKLDDFTPAVELAAKKKVAVTPTLALWARAILPVKLEDPALQLLGPFYENSWLRDAVVRDKTMTKERLDQGIAIFALQKELVKKLHDGGVALVPGSAAPNPWLFPGTALLDELSAWTSAGIPVEACVRAATAGAAERLGATTRGSLKKGRIADLIATKGDPRESVGALYKPAYVVVRGQVFDRRALEAKENDLRTALAAQRKLVKQPVAVEPPVLPDGDVVLRGRADTGAIGLRLSGERFAVVRRFDGALVYTGRVRVVGQGSMPDSETVVTQVIVDGALNSFDLSMRTGVNVVAYTAETAGGRLNWTRTSNGIPQQSGSILERVAFVDCGSVTAWLVAGYHRQPGRFEALFLDDYDLARGVWEMAVDPEFTHLCKIYGGQEAIAKYDATGAPKEIGRSTGNGVAVTYVSEVEVVDGRGLPFSAEKKAAAEKARSIVTPKTGGLDLEALKREAARADGAKGAGDGAKEGASGRPTEAGSTGPK